VAESKPIEPALGHSSEGSLDVPANQPSADIAIVGAGAIGLAVAWCLAEAGHRVVVCERGQIGRGATWAAAGMLAAAIETEPSEEALLPLTRWSQSLWPSFAARLEAASGMDIGYRDEGTIAVALTRDDVARLRHRTAFQERLGLPIAWLPGREVRTREPHLSPAVTAAVLSGEDHQVDNRALVEALAVAAGRAGVVLRADTPVAEIETAGPRVAGLRLADGTRVAAGSVVLAAGAWSGAVAGLPAGASPPVRPLKGQMLALQMDAAAPLLRHVVWGPGIYLVPRRDGRLLIGATVEERGFDPRLTAGAMLALLEAAWRVLPGIEDLPVVETWCGFRPTTPDDAPILGPGPIAGLHYATGHHRNGILLAPATAEALRAAIVDSRMPAVAVGFGLDRFRKAA